MPHKSFALWLLVLVVCYPVGMVSAHPDYSEWVNPLIGTDSEPSFSHGNTYPAVAAPFGMTFWTPRTGESSGWIYQYKAKRIAAFQATHQPSPWMGDYGNFGVTPLSGEYSPTLPSSAFVHSEEVSKPHYYAVTLPELGVRAEMTATSRAAVLQFRFDQGSTAWVYFDAYSPGNFEVDRVSGTVRGVARSNHGGVEGDFGCRFVARFNTPIKSVNESPDQHWVAVEFEALESGPESGVIEARIGTSFIDHDQAALNLKREVGDKSFDDVVAANKEVWNKRLGVIEIEGATDDQRVTFYSNLYRALLFPRIFHEENAAGELVHYSPYNGKIEPGEMFADNGFWDTFRAVYPLMSIIDPEINAAMVRGWLNAYREGGWFPKWASPGYRDCMIGTHVESVIADALCKGIDDFDIETAFAGSLRDATEVGPHGGAGRKGIAAYLELGYVPCEETGEATARTLEFAYDDWCVAQIAERIGKDQAAATLLRRAQNYRNVFDPGVGFMRGRLRSGAWRQDFEADEWGGPFTEGSSWHYSWSVLHDLPGLINLMGGDDAFVDKLDAMLAAEPTFGTGHYGGVIHEMTEMVACKMGQYAHGNQPVHHVLYLYNFAGAPWKTAAPVRQVVDTLYGPGPDGYCGDEDNGQMSAWYLFSTLGFYPVCPGKAGYAIGSPRFTKATIHLQNGKDFVIEAPGNSDANIHVGSVAVNGGPVSRSWVKHSEIAEGGVMTLKMQAEPNREWATAVEDRPFGDWPAN